MYVQYYNRPLICKASMCIVRPLQIRELLERTNLICNAAERERKRERERESSSAHEDITFNISEQFLPCLMNEP
jgi:hypothetical protein